MKTYLVLRTDRGAATRAEHVQARTPEAAARKVNGKNTSFGPERVSAAGAIRCLTFSTVYGTGEVQWANADNIRLVRYVNRPGDAPFFTDPDAWEDSGRFPLTVLA